MQHLTPDQIDELRKQCPDIYATIRDRGVTARWNVLIPANVDVVALCEAPTSFQHQSIAVFEAYFSLRNEWIWRFVGCE